MRKNTVNAFKQNAFYTVHENKKKGQNGKIKQKLF